MTQNERKLAYLRAVAQAYIDGRLPSHQHMSDALGIEYSAATMRGHRLARAGFVVMPGAASGAIHLTTLGARLVWAQSEMTGDVPKTAAAYMRRQAHVRKLLGVVAPPAAVVTPSVVEGTRASSPPGVLGGVAPVAVDGGSDVPVAGAGDFLETARVFGLEMT